MSQLLLSKRNLKPLEVGNSRFVGEDFIKKYERWFSSTIPRLIVVEAKR
jgi:hypothetical protein